jgi:mono/diheme cytochrome c family protein
LNFGSEIMKKWLLMLSVATSLLLLAACGKETEQTEPAPSTPATSPADTTPAEPDTAAEATAPEDEASAHEDEATAEAASGEAADGPPPASLERGAKLFATHCAVCHQANGQGLPGAFPPLAGSDFLAAGGTAVIENIINGLSGPITVNGQNYNSMMPPMAYIADADVADIVNFVMNSWGNPGGSVTAEDVAEVRNR